MRRLLSILTFLLLLQWQLYTLGVIALRCFTTKEYAMRHHNGKNTITLQVM